MEVFQELKKLYSNSFLDNFYLCLGLILLVFFQLVRDYILLMKRFFKFLMKLFEQIKENEISKDLEEIKFEKNNSKLKKNRVSKK